MQLYNARNQITHGDLPSRRIDTERVIQDFFRIPPSLAPQRSATARLAETQRPPLFQEKLGRSRPGPAPRMLSITNDRTGKRVN